MNCFGVKLESSETAMTMRFSAFMVVSMLLTWTNGEKLESFNQTVPATNKVLPSPRPYLHLPVYVDSGRPPVEKLHLSPNWGTGHEGLPEFLKNVLLPEAPKLNPPSASDFSVKTSCYASQIHVEVPRSILGFDVLSQLKLGTCSVSDFNTDYVYFEYDVELCGTKITMINGRVAYSNTLHYEPPSLQGSIRRAVPFTLSVACFYNRYHYSYKVGYAPRVQMRKVYKPMKNRNEFTLSPRNAQWQPVSQSDQYMLGNPMYFQAEGLSVSKDQRLYVHLCFVTPERSVTSSTIKFSVVENFGCMVESKSSRSRFIHHKNNIIRFTVDAFLFKRLSSQVYMHCTMSIESYIPTSTSKSCNYDKDKKRWVELYGSDSVCACCDSKCVSDASAAPKIITSVAWPIEPEVKHSISKNLTTLTPTAGSKTTTTTTTTAAAAKTTTTSTTSSSSTTRKPSSTTSRTKIKPLPTIRSRKVPEETSTAKPQVTSSWTVMGKVDDAAVEFRNPARGPGLKLVVEKWTDGFAVVEEDQEVMESEIFEDIFDFRE